MLAAHFGWESLAVQIFHRFPHDDPIYAENTFVNTAEVAIKNGQHLLVGAILRENDVSLQNWDSCLAILLRSKDQDWADVFTALVPRMLNKIIQWGPEMLFEVASGGNLSAAKLIFRIGETFPEFMQGVLENRQGQGKHQSVTEAARNGHVDMVQFLCQQKGLENHLRHRSGPENGTI